jgi:MFS transporter, DHA2 family, multidrug resistance protein
MAVGKAMSGAPAGSPGRPVHRSVCALMAERRALGTIASTFSMATVSRENIGEATGLTNLLRNLGGSVGISALTTLVARGAQTHQALLVGQTSQFNPVFNEQIAKVQTALTPEIGSAAAHSQAYGLTYQTLQQQATLWSYVDQFRMLVIVCLLCVPLVFLFKRPKRSSARKELAGAH